MKLTARIAGVGLLGPGLASWDEAREVLAGRRPYERRPTVVPPAEALPAVERRRASVPVRLALAAGLAAARAAALEPRDLAAIFTSSTGDGQTLHEICEALATEERLISPTRFHNSVHNAPAGYWGIATGAMGPSDSLAAYDASFGAGLLEALGRLAADPARAVLLIAYDAPYPEPLHAKRPIPDAFAVGIALTRGESLALETTRSPATRLDDPQLERLRAEIPTARALPFLQALARGGGEAVIDYLGDLRLRVKLGA